MSTRFITSTIITALLAGLAVPGFAQASPPSAFAYQLERTIQMQEHNPEAPVVRYHSPVAIGVDSDGYVDVSCKSYGLQQFDDHGVLIGSYGVIDVSNADTVSEQDLATVHDTDDYLIWGGRWKLTIKGHLIDPRGIIVDPDGTATVVDARTSTIQKYDRTGTCFNLVHFKVDNTTQHYIRSIARGPKGDYYVGDDARGVIVEITKDGKSVRTVGGSLRPQDHLRTPDAIAVGPDGSLYVADTQTGSISVFDKDGNPSIRFGGTGKDATFRNPTSLCLDNAGHLYIGASNGLFVYNTDGTYVTEVKALPPTSDDNGGAPTVPSSASAPIANITAMVIGPDKKLYVGDEATIRVYHLLNSTQAPSGDPNAGQ